MVSRAFAACSGCDKTLGTGIRNRMDSGACASRAHEKRCRPPSRTLPESIAARFRTRAFLIYFVPYALLLTISFWTIQRFVQSTVRDDLRTSLRRNQLAVARFHSKSDLQNSRFLKVAAENPALEAGIQLLVSESGSDAARRTVEDQLRELGEHMGFDFLLVSTPNGMLLAGVVRRAGDETNGNSQLVPVDTKLLEPSRKGLLLFDGRAFRVASVPIDQGEENIGSLSLGE
jgi:hypothetical protein